LELLSFSRVAFALVHTRRLSTISQVSAKNHE
jgi:hypothetical protein